MSRHSPTPGRPPGLLRRLFKGRRKISRQEAKLLPRIVEWVWPFQKEAPQGVPVHVLTGKDDWLMSAWMLASWFHFTECNWPIVIHDDGTLPDEAHPAFRKMLGDIRIIPRAEADAALTPVLRAFPFCSDYRVQQPRALKLFDIPHLAQSQQFILLDSDLLFFNYPREILDWTRTGGESVLFNEDEQENASITAGEARAELGLKLWSRVDSGLCLLNKGIIDLDLCDRAFAQTSLQSGPAPRVEQTLLMLCAAHYGKGGLLPRSYEVSSGKAAAPEAISRHYSGEVRDLFFTEGIQRLAPIFFPPEIK